MSFLKKLFGGSTPAADEAERNAQRDFDTLRDDGIRALRAGEFPFALRCFEHALTLRPDDLPLTGYLAEVLLRMQEYEKALPHLDRLARAEREHIEPRLHLAQAEGRLKRFAEQAKTAADLLADFPDDPRCAYFAAEAAYGSGDPFTAIARLTEALTRREDYAAARLLRARILADMGQWAEVLSDTTVLTADPTVDDDILLLHADALAATGEEEKAEAAYRAVLEANPFSDDAVLHLAAYYERTSRLDLALRVYDEAITERPDFAEAYRGRGGVRLRLHDEAGAADDLKRSLELRPEQTAELEGEFSNIENRMNEQFRAANPYRF